MSTAVKTQFSTTLPEQIGELQLRQYQINEEVSQIQALSIPVRANIRASVLAETIDGTPDGKPKYTNDTTRNAAVALAESESVELESYKAQAATFDDEKAEISVKLEVLRMRYQLHILDRKLEIAAYGQSDEA